MLNDRIKEDMKAAMRARAKERLSTIRLILAAIKQQEVDRRVELTDDDILVILDKMVKQRKDSIEQYNKAERKDLADKEQIEIEVIQAYLPQQLSQDEILALVDEAISATGAESMRDMGKIMGMLKPKLQGRADMGQVSGLIKSKLS
ncbi:MAG: GatB/YqeY domain-containing protein [Gammaproteobacteria bacterium]|nr:GatB/YqeY domain-containing protein [Gammaproteobacteria bacterium]NNJ73487.1 GatB/YqeY domain-containing protein [Enterobacterales bacterium]